MKWNKKYSDNIQWDLGQRLYASSFDRLRMSVLFIQYCVQFHCSLVFQFLTGLKARSVKAAKPLIQTLRLHSGLKARSVKAAKPLIQSLSKDEAQWKNKTNISEFCLKIFFLFFFSTTVNALTVGSNTTPSRQATITFPSTDINNTILGFASMEGGFALQNGDATCTYDSFLPVSGDMRLNGGILYLLQDLTFSNSAIIHNGAYIYGNNHAIEQSKILGTPIFPEPATQWAMRTIVSTSMSNSVWGFDWSYDNKYIVACSRQTPAGNTPQELALYYFDGSKLTLTLSIDEQRDCFSVSCNPKDMHFALGRDSGVNQELRVYEYKVSNGTIILDDSRTLGGVVSAVTWHPSGDDLVIGNTNAAQEIIPYSFSRSTGLLTDGTAVNLTPDRTTSRSAFSWSPGANYLSLGTAAADQTIPNLTVFSFDGTNLVITASANAGTTNAYVRGIDWCPTGTYIAVGLESGSEKIRIYAHSISPQGLSEVQSARVGASQDIRSVHWDPTGSYLLVSVNAGGGSGVSIYSFNKNSLTLSLVDSIASPVPVYRVRWSRDGSNFAYGTAANKIVVAGSVRSENQTMFFKDTTLIFNNDTFITTTLFFEGNCKINGNGNHLYLQNNAGFSVRPSSTLSCDNVVVAGVGRSNIACTSDSGRLGLKNTTLILSSDLTFSRGSILFDDDVFIQGQGKFNYTTALSSTIQSLSTLFIDSGITFSYDPRTAKRSLIVMADVTSNLFMNGCSLHVTRTGLRLSGGTLIIDNAVTMSSEARNSGEAVTFASNLTTKVLGSAIVNMQGRFKIE